MQERLWRACQHRRFRGRAMLDRGFGCPRRNLLLGLMLDRGSAHARPAEGPLDQALPQRVRHGLRPIAEIQPASHVMDDVLDGPLGVEQAAADLGRIESVRE